MISTEARCVPDARSWNNCALYLSSGLVNWNPWKLTLPAPAPAVALPIVIGFWASSVNDDRSNALVAPANVGGRLADRSRVELAQIARRREHHRDVGLAPRRPAPCPPAPADPRDPGDPSGPWGPVGTWWSPRYTLLVPGDRRLAVGAGRVAGDRLVGSITRRLPTGESLSPAVRQPAPGDRRVLPPICATAIAAPAPRAATVGTNTFNDALIRRRRRPDARAGRLPFHGSSHPSSGYSAPHR